MEWDMIRLGPAGIPLSCKGRELKDGVEDIHALELNAMEYQLVRRKEFDPEELELVRDLAKALDVQMSVHTPYYMDLVSEGDTARKYREILLWAMGICEGLGGVITTTHVGLYGNKGPVEAVDAVVNNLRAVRNQAWKAGYQCLIGLETSGKQAVFGSLEEVLEVSKRVAGVVPVLNFAHLHARRGGSLKRSEDFAAVIDEVGKALGTRTFYSHFSGVEHQGGNEKRCTPIKRGDMRFDPLADAVLENDYDITIISSSPLMEHDAMYMKVIFDRVRQKREMKAHKL